MQQKSTMKAYLIAVAIIVALLVYLGISYANAPIGEDFETPFAATFWSLLPPICAIVLALISKEVYSSLFFGCVIGSLLYTQFRPWEAIQALVGSDYGFLCVLCDGWNMGIILFLVELGIISDLMNKGGGSEAFGRWAKDKVKSRASAQLMTMLLGMLIFIDDYFNCLTVGAVMRPVTESHNISRAKLAYIIDATAAPVCMIAPISSWAAAVSGYVNDASANGFELFIKQIPWNYYCILTLVMIVVISIKNIDYGPMLQHEHNALVHNDLFTTEHRPFEGADNYEAPSDKKSSVADLLVPVIALIILCVIGMIFTGGFFDGESFVDSFANCDAAYGLALGGTMGVIFAFLYFMGRRLISFEKSFESVPKGFIQMVSPILILVLAWTLCSFTRYALCSKEFVEAALENADALKNFLPAVIFILGAVIGFATGTSWGTIGIMAPIVVEVFNYDVDPTLCVIGLAAACSGGVMGDHCSPISDTTIMASAGAHCYHLNHVFTQLPYALTVAIVSFLSFLLAGFVRNAIVCLLFGVVAMVVVLLVIDGIERRRKSDMFKAIDEAYAAHVGR